MSETKNRGGRPRVDAVPVTLRLPPDLLHKIDAYRQSMAPQPTRPEAVRQLLLVAFARIEAKGE